MAICWGFQVGPLWTGHIHPYSGYPILRHTQISGYQLHKNHFFDGECIGYPLCGRKKGTCFSWGWLVGCCSCWRGRCAGGQQIQSCSGSWHPFPMALWVLNVLILKTLKLWIMLWMNIQLFARTLIRTCQGTRDTAPFDAPKSCCSLNP